MGSLLRLTFVCKTTIISLSPDLEYPFWTFQLEVQEQRNVQFVIPIDEVPHFPYRNNVYQQNNSCIFDADS